MEQISTIGLDIAKNVFQVHGVDETGETVIRRQLRRSQVLPFFEKLPSCLVGMEACATAQACPRQGPSPTRHDLTASSHCVICWWPARTSDVSNPIVGNVLRNRINSFHGQAAWHRTNFESCYPIATLS